MHVLALVGTLLASDAAWGEPWDRFMRNPDIEAFEELSQEIDGARCGWGKPANKEVVPDRVRGDLFDLIASGNDGAFLIGLSVVRCFDGGDLEDFYRSSGKYLEQSPQRFLARVTERDVTASEVASMAASVPTDDDIDAALRTVVGRIELLRELDDDGFARARMESIRALQKREHSLRQIKESLEQRK